MVADCIETDIGRIVFSQNFIVIEIDNRYSKYCTDYSRVNRTSDSVRNAKTGWLNYAMVSDLNQPKCSQNPGERNNLFGLHGDSLYFSALSFLCIRKRISHRFIHELD